MFVQPIFTMTSLNKILLPLLITGFITVMMSSCANIIPPGGGPRDSLPPKLLFALPKDSAVNISPKLITLNFDEYITLQNVNAPKPQNPVHMIK